MTTPINPMAEALLAFSETMSCITDAVTGYRAQLEAAGFSPTASEVMATKYHDVLMASLTSAFASKVK